MAIFGWKTMKEAERHTRAARQKITAGSAMRLLVPERNQIEGVPLFCTKVRDGTLFASKSLKNFR